MTRADGRKLLLHSLRDVYDAEHRFVDALGAMAKRARDRSLVEGIRRHRKTSDQQIKRLAECFEEMGEKPRRGDCGGAHGIINDYTGFVRSERPDTELHDLFVAIAGLKIEHFEIATYAGLIDLALRLDLKRIAKTFQDNLKEEETAAIEFEIAVRMLGGKVTESSAGLLGAAEAMRATARSGGLATVGRLMREQASETVGRLERRGRRATTSTRKRAASTASKTRSSTTGRAAKKRSTTRRPAAKRTTTRRPAAKRTSSRQTARRSPTRSKVARKRPVTRTRKRPAVRKKATRRTR